MQQDQKETSSERLLQAAQYFVGRGLRDHLYANLQTLKDCQLQDVGIRHGRVFINLSVPTSKEEPNMAGFTITVDKQYPIGGVRLYMSTNLTEVRVNDMRDHLEVAVGREWDRQMKFGTICEKLRDYVTLLNDLCDQPVLLQKVGKYHLGEIFHLDFLTKSLGLELFSVTEKIENKEHKRFFYVSETHLVILALLPSKNKTSSTEHVYVLQFMDLQSIGQVQLDQNKPAMTLRLRRHRLIKGFTEQEWEERYFLMKDLSGLLRAILKGMFRCQRIWTDFQPSKSVDPAIKNHLASLKELEKEHRERPTTATTDKLNNLYNKLMQWYSKRGDSLYLLFVEKIKCLHQPTAE